MNIQHSMSKYVVAAACASAFGAIGATHAAEIKCYSFPDGIVFMGGGPGPGQFVADRTVVTRRAQFAEFGRGGHLSPLPVTRYADASGGVNDGPDALLRPAQYGTDQRHARLADRLGRE